MLPGRLPDADGARNQFGGAPGGLWGTGHETACLNGLRGGPALSGRPRPALPRPEHPPGMALKPLQELPEGRLPVDYVRVCGRQPPAPRHARAGPGRDHNTGIFSTNC